MQVQHTALFIDTKRITGHRVNSNKRGILMWIAENWKDYEVLDTSQGEKLERWTNYLLVRPDPPVI